MNFNNPGKSMYFITGTVLFTGFDYFTVASTLLTQGLSGFSGTTTVAAFFTVAKPFEIIGINKEMSKKINGGKKRRTRKKVSRSSLPEMGHKGII